MTKGLCYKAWVLLLLIIFVVSAACSDKGDDLEEAMTDYIELLTRFGRNLSESNGREDVLEAVKDYRKGVQELLPRFRRLDQKYPKLSRALAREKPEKELPPRLRKLKERLVRVRQEVMDKKVQKKLQKYGNDPEVLLELTKLRRSTQGKKGAAQKAAKDSPE